MKTKIFLSVLSATLIFLSGCVKDDMFVNNTTPGSDIKLVINEVASNNGDPNPDWMEIYNPGDAEVDISGFGVYDKPAAIYTIPAGTKIAAKGYFVIVCDVALAGTDASKYAAFGISSGGESVFLVDATKAIIDQVDVPAMPVGISYARIPDGGDVFANANPTKGAENSNTNEPPVIVAQLINGVDDNNYFDYTVTASDAGGIRDVKIYTEDGTDIKISEMAPAGGGIYKYRFPVMTGGSIVKYYVVATDITDKKTYFPTTAPTTPATFTVANGAPTFKSVTPSSLSPSDGEAIDFTVNVLDKTGVKEVRLYYVLNDALAATKTTVILTTTDYLTFTGTIPGQANMTKIRYYLRAEDNAAAKAYFPTEVVVDGVVTSTFNHDDASTWPLITVAPLPNYAALVLNEVCGLQDPDDDWIEIYNTSNAEVDMSNVKLVKDGAASIYTAPVGTKIAANAYFVVTTKVVAPVVGLTAGISNTKNVKLELTSPQNVVFSSFEKTAVNLIGGHPLNGSYARSPNATGDWVITTAFTKGAANN
jgi:hypothetical protein